MTLRPETSAVWVPPDMMWHPRDIFDHAERFSVVMNLPRVVEEADQLSSACVPLHTFDFYSGIRMAVSRDMIGSEHHYIHCTVLITTNAASLNLLSQSHYLMLVRRMIRTLSGGWVVRLRSCVRREVKNPAICQVLFEFDDIDRTSGLTIEGID